MKRLILMRHAKSSWSKPGLADHDRPLNDRGRTAASALGVWLREQDLQPQECLVSSSARTQETFRRLGVNETPSRDKTLYHASSEEMLSVLRKALHDVVLMIGHNPGIAYFAEELVSAPPEHPQFFNFPTCATLVVDLDIPGWAELKLGAGEVKHFVVPRDLVG